MQYPSSLISRFTGRASPDTPSGVLLTVGLAALVLPTLWRLVTGIWADEGQAHGPIILALGLWLLAGKRTSLQALPPDSAAVTGWLLAVPALGLYVLGRSQNILLFEVGSLPLMLAATVLWMRGWPGLRLTWFALFFLLFLVPLPAVVVDALTAPMKAAVSWVAEQVLYRLGYPIARSGVILQIGPYQLLVADACAGLHTLFTLEALGLLYLNLVQSASVWRNTLLAVLIVPISFSANVIRVITLSLITYHFGDAAGQGFLHWFAGMVLFFSALLLILAADAALGLVLSKPDHPTRTQEGWA